MDVAHCQKCLCHLTFTLPAQQDRTLGYPTGRASTHIFCGAVLAGIPLLAVEADDDTLAQEEGSPHDHIPEGPFPTVIQGEVEDHWKGEKWEALFRNKPKIQESKTSWFYWIFCSFHFISGATRLQHENLVMLGNRANTLSWFWHLLPVKFANKLRASGDQHLCYTGHQGMAGVA